MADNVETTQYGVEIAWSDMPPTFIPADSLGEAIARARLGESQFTASVRVVGRTLSPWRYVTNPLTGELADLPQPSATVAAFDWDQPLFDAPGGN